MVEWSYRLLDDHERRVFRVVSVFPGPFTLEAAEAVAGADAGPAVLHLVDCSLLVPPRPGADGRSRYGMLETLRAYGAGPLAQAGRRPGRPRRWPGTRWEREEAATGLQTSTGEVAAARWLDAEDATMVQVLAWAWNTMRPRRCGWRWRWHRGGCCAAGRRRGTRGCARRPIGPSRQRRVVRRAVLARPDRSRRAGYGRGAGPFHRGPGRDRDRGPSRTLAACLAGRADTLQHMGQLAEATAEARRSLALAREIGDPAAEALALLCLGLAAWYADDTGDALQLYRQARQIPATSPAGSPGCAASYWPLRWPRLGTWPPPSAPAPTR